jgi:hypothetical protein
MSAIPEDESSAEEELERMLLEAERLANQMRSASSPSTRHTNSNNSNNTTNNNDNSRPPRNGLSLSSAAAVASRNQTRRYDDEQDSRSDVVSLTSLASSQDLGMLLRDVTPQAYQDNEDNSDDDDDEEDSALSYPNGSENDHDHDDGHSSVLSSTTSIDPSTPSRESHPDIDAAVRAARKMQQALQALGASDAQAPVSPSYEKPSPAQTDRTVSPVESPSASDPHHKNDSSNHQHSNDIQWEPFDPPREEDDDFVPLQDYSHTAKTANPHEGLPSSPHTPVSVPPRVKQVDAGGVLWERVDYCNNNDDDYVPLKDYSRNNMNNSTSNRNHNTPTKRPAVVDRRVATTSAKLRSRARRRQMTVALLLAITLVVSTAYYFLRHYQNVTSTPSTRPSPPDSTASTTITTNATKVDSIESPEGPLGVTANGNDNVDNASAHILPVRVAAVDTGREPAVVTLERDQHKRDTRVTPTAFQSHRRSHPASAASEPPPKARGDDRCHVPMGWLLWEHCDPHTKRSERLESLLQAMLQ